MEALAPAGRALWLQESARTGDEEATDVYDLADRDAEWWFERQGVIGGVADSGRNIEPQESSMRPLWKAVEADPRRFALAYAGGLLGLPWEDLRLLEGELRQTRAVVDRLRDDERRLLSRLTVHRRALPIEVFHAAFPDDLGALTRLRELGIVDTFGADILIAPPWTLTPLEPPEVAVHRDLADAFATVVDDAARSRSVRGLSALEAQRHYSRCDDPEAWRKALLLASYGVRSVFRTAVRLSKDGDPARARQLYRVLLDVHREAAPRPLLGRRAHAYALHYEAENRRRSEEPEVSAAVMIGFRQSLLLWPENAHFWGDSVFALALRGDIEGARASREQAYTSVDRTHPGSAEHITRRPVARLTGPHLWKAFGLAMESPEAPSHTLKELDERVLSWGKWWTRTLWCTPNLMLAFTSVIGIEFARIGDEVAASFGPVTTRSGHAVEALRRLILALADVIEAGLVSELPLVSVTPPLAEETMALYGQRSRWLAALAALRDDAGPAARLVRESWRRVAGRLADSIDDRPELVVLEGGALDLAWSAPPDECAEVEVSASGDIALTATPSVRAQRGGSGPRAVRAAWLDALATLASSKPASYPQAPGVARVLERAGTGALTVLRWSGRDLPPVVALRDGSVLELPAEEADVLYWIDYDPDANWAHRCAFVIAGVDGALVREVPARWPPRLLPCAACRRALAVDRTSSTSSTGSGS